MCVSVCLCVYEYDHVCLEKFPEGNTPQFQKRLSLDGGIAAVLFSSYAFLYFQVFCNKKCITFTPRKK